MCEHKPRPTIETPDCRGCAGKAGAVGRTRAGFSSRATEAPTRALPKASPVQSIPLLAILARELADAILRPRREQAAIQFARDPRPPPRLVEAVGRRLRTEEGIDHPRGGSGVPVQLLACRAPRRSRVAHQITPVPVEATPPPLKAGRCDARHSLHLSTCAMAASGGGMIDATCDAPAYIAGRRNLS